MNYQNPPLQGQAKNVTDDYGRALEKDARLQADPELASSEGRATLPAVAVYFTAMVFIVCVVLYGLNNQRDETVTNASAPAAEAAGNNVGETPQQQGNAPAGQQQGNANANQPQGQNNSQGQANAPAKQQQGQNPPPKQQSQDNQQPTQPQQGLTQPPQQNQAPNAQQNAPAPKQQ